MTDLLLDAALNSLKKMASTTKQLTKDIDDAISKVNAVLNQRTLDEYE